MYIDSESSTDTELESTYTDSDDAPQEIWETESGIDYPNPNYNGPSVPNYNGPSVPKAKVAPRPVKVIDDNMDYILALRLQKAEQRSAKFAIQYPSYYTYDYQRESEGRVNSFLSKPYAPMLFCVLTIFLFVVGLFAIKGALEDVRPTKSIKLYCDYSCAQQNNTVIEGRQECKDLLNRRLASDCKRYDVTCCGNDFCVCRTSLVCDNRCNWRNFGYYVIFIFGIFSLFGAFSCLILCWRSVKEDPHF